MKKITIKIDERLIQEGWEGLRERYLTDCTPLVVDYISAQILKNLIEGNKNLVLEYEDTDSEPENVASLCKYRKRKNGGK